MPSATGHFLSAYAACQAQVTLVDCCQEMLSAAGRRAEGIGLQGFRLALSPIQNLASEAIPVDLVVIPNAALNQLAAGTHLVTLLTAVAQVLKSGGLLLLQILDLHDDGTIGACNFYTPGIGEQELVTDRKFTDEDGSLLVVVASNHVLGGYCIYGSNFFGMTGLATDTALRCAYSGSMTCGPHCPWPVSETSTSPAGLAD